MSESPGDVEIGIFGGGVAATFAYDSFGRRTRKTLREQTTDVLYDWDNPVQELSGGAGHANLLTGLPKVHVRPASSRSHT